MATCLHFKWRKQWFRKLVIGADNELSQTSHGYSGSPVEGLGVTPVLGGLELGGFGVLPDPVSQKVG